MEPTNSFDVIIGGGGIAGLTSGAYLAKAGYRVLLCEKNAQVGGLVSSFERQGFHFDAGDRAFENSGVIFPMLKQLGIDVAMVKNEITIGLADDLVTLVDKSSLKDYQKLLEKHFPDSHRDIALIINQIKKVMKYMEVLYGIDNPLFSDSMNDPEYLLKTIMPWLVKYQINIKKVKKLNQPINDYLLQFTKNPKLIDFITQHFFADTPAFFALSYFGLYLDYYYPCRGTQALPLELEKYINDHGGFVLKSTRITEIDLDGKTVITSNQEKFKFKKLIWAGDNKTLYAIAKSTRLDNNIKIEARQIKTNLAQGGDSVVSVFLGADLPSSHFAKRTGVHCFYTPINKGISGLEQYKDYRKLSQYTLKEYLHEYFQTTTYEVSVPALRNRELAPANQTGVIISTLLDYQLVEQVVNDLWYPEFKDFVIQEIIGVFDATFMPGLKDKIIESSCATPWSIAKINGSYQGAITGWSFANKQPLCVSDLSLIAKAVQTDFLDVYQCGQWSFSPSGVPVSIITGKLASDQVAKELWRKEVKKRD